MARGLLCRRHLINEEHTLAIDCAPRTLCTMCRQTNVFVLVCFLVLGLVSGCSSPSYNTDVAQACSNAHVDPGETDVDCGGNCVPCVDGRSCVVDTDCANATCLGKICYAATCRNQRQDSNETDIDCGGGSCSACPDTKHCLSDTDCANGNSCINKICYNATCHDAKLDGTESDVDCGGSCVACGDARACSVDKDCANGTCISHICYQTSCRNGRLDSTETDVDCGGDKCPACSGSKACSTDNDCGNGYGCIGKLCYVATCRDSRQDGTETSSDCGGDTCPACQAGANCLQNTDCVAGTTCTNGRCYVSSCSDQKLDNTETDIDCGGVQCPVCEMGRTCNQSSDCVGNVPCTKNKCGDPQCFDLKMDGNETDADCGGSCAGCGLGGVCNVAADCASLNCSSNVCAPPNCHDGNQNGGESDADCGDAAGICPRCAPSKTCADSISCASNHCVAGVCAAAVCTDQIINGTETDKDCGGSCNPCADGLSCLTSADCQSKVCQNGKCQGANCSDGVANGLETGKDCGGPCTQVTPSQKCPNGQGCKANSDCVQNTCTALICAFPLCSNKVLDPGETDVDCGGSCPACGDGLKCTLAQDCQSKVCNAQATCDAPSCSDAVQNGNETDVNCGGVTCTQRCLTGASCLSDSDCQSKVCDAKTNTCALPTCFDTVQNGTETGPDCGGVCAQVSPAKTCVAGATCSVDDDCSSNNCCTASTCKNLNVCEAPSCQDGKKNQGETGIDCGGTPPAPHDPPGTGCTLRCGTNQGCNDATDCISGVCTSNLCQAPICTDGVQNGSEVGKDCGSSCPKGCTAGTPCTGPGDCESSNCQKDTGGAYTTCAAALCTDGIQNGTETAIDCGGGNCPACGLGKTCLLRTDCDQTITPVPDCISLVCAQPQCNDGKQDGAETDKDCGGGTCAKCANGLKCSGVADCLSGVCAADTTGTCSAPTCSDKVQNQGESGIDCGGTSPCAKCGTGLGCTSGTDCVSGVCGASNTCSAPTCSDTVQNQGETDKDCGGVNCRSSTTACVNGKACGVNADCQENWCVSNVCTHPTCVDTVLNGTETDVDCGGTCPSKCANTKSCTKDTDCVNGWCNAQAKCATPACGDGFKNGTETGPDCGGSCAASCPTKFDSTCMQCSDGSTCATNLDCKSLNCGSNNTCLAPTNCVAKELNGQGPAGCTICASANPSDVPKCKLYLLCFALHGCNGATGKDASGIDCITGAAVCGTTTIGTDIAPQTAAINTYKCSGC
jgi:hypothetical protein